MPSVVERFEQAQRKSQVPDIRSGDTVRVHQQVVEGSKVRTQGFEGVVIRTRQMNSLMASITVRRISSGVGVEKTFKLHAPNIEKVEVLRRSKVRRNYLSFLRQRQGKAARLQEISFDRVAAEIDDTTPVVEEEEKEAPTTPAEEQEKATEGDSHAESTENETPEASEEDETAGAGEGKTGKAEDTGAGEEQAGGEKDAETHGSSDEEGKENPGSAEHNESEDVKN